MEFATTDLCDEHDDLSIADPLFTNLGSSEPFAGPIATVKVHEDNVLVRQTLESEGAGRVLVVDGGGSLRCALVGDLLVSFALDNDWVGIVVNGAVRDVGPMRTMGLPYELSRLVLTSRSRMALVRLRYRSDSPASTLRPVPGCMPMTTASWWRPAPSI